MFIYNGKLLNIFAPIEVNSIKYPNLLDPQLRQTLGVQEIPEPNPPTDYSEELYSRTEIQEPPYVAYTKKPPEQIAQERSWLLLLTVQQPR